MIAAEEAWVAEAACLGADPEIFFPIRGDNHMLAKAKAICAVCPVKDDCREYALTNFVKHGVWGGTSERERRRIRRARGLVA